MDPKGKVVVITGATSGLGQAAAVDLARRGARVFVVGRDAADVGEVGFDAGLLEASLGLRQRALDESDEDAGEALGLDETLINLADLTSNLNAQVQMNTNLVSNVNSAIISADTLMQGLKRHWLLRSAFKEKKPKEPKPTKTKK